MPNAVSQSAHDDVQRPEGTAAGKSSKTHSFLYQNGLGIVALTLFIFALVAQTPTGWHEHNAELTQKGAVDREPVETGK